MWAIIAYFCGSVPFGLLIGFTKGIDLREYGSGNLGATNAVRVLGKKLGVLCFLLDVAKGFVPVFVGGWVLGYIGRTELTSTEAWQWLVICVCAVMGHVFPMWLKFKGGKGVATGLGTMLGIWPLLTVAALVTFVTWVVVLKLSRFVSLASMIGAVMLPVYVVIGALMRGQKVEAIMPFIIVTALLAVLVVFRHRSNIARLIAGKEDRAGEWKNEAPPPTPKAPESSAPEIVEKQ
jgi:glycerol-3-phosphate acyltransferase PlsY